MCSPTQRPVNHNSCFRESLAPRGRGFILTNLLKYRLLLPVFRSRVAPRIRALQITCSKPHNTGTWWWLIRLANASHLRRGLPCSSQPPGPRLQRVPRSLLGTPPDRRSTRPRELTRPPSVVSFWWVARGAGKKRWQAHDPGSASGEERKEVAMATLARSLRQGNPLTWLQQQKPAPSPGFPTAATNAAARTLYSLPRHHRVSARERLRRGAVLPPVLCPW